MHADRYLILTDLFFAITMNLVTFFELRAIELGGCVK